MDRTRDLAASFALFGAAPKRKTKSQEADYAQRLALEKILQQRRYCDAFALWQSCREGACRRYRRCIGDAHRCLKRALDRVPQHDQWRVRQEILAATPANIGAPERAARQLMPRDFYRAGK